MQRAGLLVLLDHNSNFLTSGLPAKAKTSARSLQAIKPSWLTSKSRHLRLPQLLQLMLYLFNKPATGGLASGN
jgi:hypothetical protein